MSNAPLSSEDQKAIEAAAELNIGPYVDHKRHKDTFKIGAAWGIRYAESKSAGSSPAVQNYICVNCKLVTNHKQTRCIQCGCQTHEPTAAAVTYPADTRHEHAGSSPAESDKWKEGFHELEKQIKQMSLDHSSMREEWKMNYTSLKERNSRLVKALELIKVMALLKPTDERSCEIWTEAKAAIESEEKQP